MNLLKKATEEASKKLIEKVNKDIHHSSDGNTDQLNDDKRKPTANDKSGDRVSE